MIESEDVAQLKANREYRRLKNMSAKKRHADGATKKFYKMRDPIRKNAVAAREAYGKAATAQPDTPDIKAILQVNFTCIKLR